MSLHMWNNGLQAAQAAALTTMDSLSLLLPPKKAGLGLTMIKSFLLVVANTSLKDRTLKLDGIVLKLMTEGTSFYQAL